MGLERDNKDIAILVQRVLAGDELAHAELIEATQSRLYKFCLLISHNREIAEDLCQETFIKSFHNIKSLKNPETFVGWMYQIARNLFIDMKRKPASKEEHQAETTLHAGRNADLDVIMNVQKVLSHFEPDDKILLLLVELEGYSYKEAAETIGTTEDAVRSKLHRLRALFIKKFNSAG